MNYSVTGFQLVLTRKMSFYVVTYYLPSGLFVVVSWIRFVRNCLLGMKQFLNYLICSDNFLEADLSLVREAIEEIVRGDQMNISFLPISVSWSTLR